MKLELVTWRDAFHDLDYAKARKDFLVKTVGWTKREGRWLTIINEKQPEGSDPDYRGVTRIPIENVVKRKKLK